MNTTHTPPSALTEAGAFHESTRTSISVNRDPVTGERNKVLTSSRLSLSWAAGELVIACKASRVNLGGVRPRNRRMQR